ncbi:AP2-like ethylene-responsive transcription factor PLT2 [Hevea brasiliensis]|uniref:AP2-like ethylene-responsive transcription factor PLT2 n=1 Tax=Hevea brasiliensis TaxID=3981 RepID=UPI0025CB866D|nr:AP2-like ethylene-responsive transcription factor PLT2 [Hevea brasiliensis]XP_057996028.1 AP2-like ethylene-responsive transcription factor PLT2 [Hevea brasiliensis]XP_057996030.1 AP2-like ethylene-responsive transcription factor PLT2 [Hevea brasiliensis]XP_057996031.1 AP2-like ethylene-responsive transcription factor PLT2 [Hevea brasiliensis]XP_057996032.1 AP2-like ethylene-responsive transcription factor PLT2 [Hevea brasiliensis]
MNSNNWLSFPLSPTHSSLPNHLHAPHPQQFSLGLVTENLDNPFQTQEWSLINTQGGSEVPKVADFLGVTKSENQSDLVAFNEIQANVSDYMFPGNSLVPVQNTVLAASGNYEFPENANNLQSLTLSMGGASGKVSSTCETSGDTSTNTVEAATPRRTLDTFGQRTSIFRGVTRHRWTGRYEAHLWDNSCRREGQSRKGRQGGYDKEEKAARAYDLAALKYWGTSTTTNFPISNYEKELEEMKHMTRQEFVASIRRKSSGFSRGASMYRGVTRHHQHGRWQARIGRVAGNKDLYLGTFSTEEEAAEAYDIAAIKFRGLNAVTNFDMNRYDVKSILESNTLPIGGGAAKRLKEAQAIESSRKREEMIALGSGFQYGSSSSSRLQAYSLTQAPFEQPQPLLTLQNQDISQYAQDASFHQNFLQTQLHLHQQSAGTNYLQQSSQNPQFYNSYIQNNPALLHGLFNMGSSSSIMENNGSSSGSYSGGYLGNGLGIASNSSGSNVVGSAEEVAFVKVDYDMPSASYGSWSGDSVQGSNPGLFTMWND